jgi:hypothetical protein
MRDGKLQKLSSVAMPLSIGCTPRKRYAAANTSTIGVR